MKKRPLVKLDVQAISLKAKKMRDFLLSRIRGQNRALQYVINACERLFSPFRDENKPIFVCLELGPSGVGKTLLAESLAEYMFGDPKAFTKINCAEYSQPHEVARLKGSPPGYIGYVDPEEDPCGSNCILGQYSIDKHHHLFLRKKHASELTGLKSEEVRLKVESRKLDALSEKIKGLESQADDLKKQAQLLKKEVSIKKVKKLPQLRKELKKLSKEIQKLKTRYNKESNSYVDRILKWFKKDNEAAERGWIYNPASPPKELRSIILFDEIEKADEDLFEHLLEIMDKGRLQLGNGLVTNFQNSFILMTSNIGRTEIARALRGERELGFKHAVKTADLGAKEIDSLIFQIATEEAIRIFPPEFMGRLDKIIVFRPLSRETMLEILGLLMSELHTELVRRKCPLIIELDQSVETYIIERAMKYPELGARLLKSRITDHIKDKLIILLNTNQIKLADKIVVKMETINEKKEMVFYKEEN